MMLGEPESQFMARVRDALADRGAPVELTDDLEVARVLAVAGDLVEEFTARAEQAKSHVYRVADEAEMIEQVMTLVRESGAASVIVPQDGLPARERLLNRLQEAGVQICDPDQPDAAFSADVAITGVEQAIAETGSICLASGGGRRRLASLAVPVHIAVVRAEQIVPDLLDWAATASQDRPASETLVSAPSKTADIELALVMGVHGPREEHIVILE